MVVLLLLITLSTTVIVFLYNLWWAPLHIQQRMKSQGIKGPSYRFYHGTTQEILALKKAAMSTPMDPSQDIFPRIQPHFYTWIKSYGNNFVYWIGTEAQLVITDPELIKEILNNKQGSFPKTRIEGYIDKLLGDGIVTTEGDKWIKLRKLSNHAFHGDCLKGMFGSMVGSVESMLEKWKDYEGKAIEVCGDFRVLTSEVISRTAFGSSYLEGTNIFNLLTQLSAVISRNAYAIRFFGIQRLFRSKDDIEASKIEQLLHDSIMKLVNKRQDEVAKGDPSNFGDDFLGSLLKAHHNKDHKSRISTNEIIDECKTFYFAGHDTTYSLLSWSVMLLAIHTDWQEKARSEVLELFGQENPNYQGIARLKIVNMILYETLRLYSPATSIVRRIEGKVVKLGKYEFPGKVNLVILPLVVHRNPEIWGQDALHFRPERFSEGLAKATNGNPTAFLGFGFGPRMCVGMNFAMNEAKIALSMILQRYRFKLSPNYVHSPSLVLTTQPQHGVQILLQPL